jgi:hypothetical protein
VVIKPAGQHAVQLSCNAPAIGSLDCWPSLPFPLPARLQEEASALKAAEQRNRQLSREFAGAREGAAAAAAERAVELDGRFAEADKLLSTILKAANGGLKAVAGGREEAKALADALRSSSSSGGAENAGGGVPASAGRQSRQSSGSGRRWH